VNTSKRPSQARSKNWSFDVKVVTCGRECLQKEGGEEEGRGGRGHEADLHIWLGDDERLVPIFRIFFIIVFAIGRELDTFFVDDTLSTDEGDTEADREGGRAEG
jgi:hypothetical protein